MIDFTGGEDVALRRLKHYLWDTNAIATYFDTRNGMLLADQSTKFSPALALGCLSPRLIYQVCVRLSSAMLDRVGVPGIFLGMRNKIGVREACHKLLELEANGWQRCTRTAAQKHLLLLITLTTGDLLLMWHAVRTSWRRGQFTYSTPATALCRAARSLLAMLRVARQTAGRIAFWHMQEVKRYEEQRKGNKSTYWVIFELTWRDYYRYLTMRSGNAIFLEYGITNKKVCLDCGSLHGPASVWICTG